MINLDTRHIVSRLSTLESLAVIPRLASTNLVARRIVDECIENELSLPQAMIVAGEQFAGRGRNERQWSSPPGKGIYATTLVTRPAEELPMVPLEMANIVATYLRDTFGIDARIKWPNDILAGGRKIAGILMEARIQDHRVYLIIGIGINIEPVQAEDRPNAVAVAEVASRDFRGIAAAIEAFIDHMDKRLSRPFERRRVLEEWRRLSIHGDGESVTCVIGERTVSGEWAGIDEHGRAVLRDGAEMMVVSAGDLILTQG